MVFFNYATMQMAAKIVYYGPGLGGKTTNLHWIYSKTAPQSRGEMVSLETETDRTLFFDLLPLDVGVIGGFKTRLQLYTVPGQVFYNTTRKLVLKGVDGVVFVADSQRAMFEANVESFRNLQENLAEIGLELADLPVVIQLNKKDLPNRIERDVILQTLDPDGKSTAIDASAIAGEGVFETLKEISKLTLRNLRKRMMGEEPAKPQAAVLARQALISRQTPKAPRETHVGFNPSPAFLKGAPIIPPAAMPIGPSIVASSATVSQSLHALKDPAQSEARVDSALRIEENPFPDVSDVDAALLEEGDLLIDQAGPLDEVEIEVEMPDDLPAPDVPPPQPDSEIHFLETPDQISEEPPKVKHVRVRSIADIMAELDALRRKATESTGKGRLPGSRAATQKLVLMPTSAADLARTASVRVTVSFEDENGNVVQRNEQVVTVEETDVQSLLLKVKIDTNS